jgi:hypothetical protein
MFRYAVSAACSAACRGLAGVDGQLRVTLGAGEDEALEVLTES